MTSAYGACIALGTVLAVTVPASARAAKIAVPPGDGTLAAAIDTAGDGDTLVLSSGTYGGAVVVSRPLRIVSDPANPATIDAGCEPTAALAVAADGVAIRGVTVTGGAHAGIDAHAHRHLTVKDTWVYSTCPALEFGIDIVAGDAVKLQRIHVSTGASPSPRAG